MVKIELLKDNEHGKKGDIILVTPDRANYLIRCNGAKEYVVPKPKKETESKKDTENDKPRITRKSKGKS